MAPKTVGFDASKNPLSNPVGELIRRQPGQQSHRRAASACSIVEEEAIGRVEVVELREGAAQSSDRPLYRGLISEQGDAVRTDPCRTDNLRVVVVYV